MNRDDIITLAGELSLSLHDPDTLDIFVDDVFHELGESSDIPLVQATLKQLTSGTATYDFESDMIQIIHLIMYDELITESSYEELTDYSETWKADSGTPVTFTQDRIDSETYTLYPSPSSSSSAYIPTEGEPFGVDYPANILTILYTDDRESDIPEIYSLPIAIDALEREFTYPSDHTDVEFASACGEIKKLFYLLIGFKNAS